MCKILQFTLVTHGRFFRVRLGATMGTNIPILTHNILIIIVLLCRCSRYMSRYVSPRTIWRVPYLSSNQKLLQMQEYAHVLMQLRTGSPPYVPYDASVPHTCKQVLNECPIEIMNIIVLLLPLGQRLSTDKWPCHMEAPLVYTIHGANLIIDIMSLHPFGPLAIIQMTTSTLPCRARIPRVAANLGVVHLDLRRLPKCTGATSVSC